MPYLTVCLIWHLIRALPPVLRLPCKVIDVAFEKNDIFQFLFYNMNVSLFCLKLSQFELQTKIAGLITCVV